MAERWKEYAKAGIVHFMACPEVAAGSASVSGTAAELLRDGFFEVLEVGPVDDAGEREKLRALAARTGASLAFAAQPLLLSRKLDLNSLDSAARAAAVAAVKGGIAQARELQAVAVSVLSGPDPGAASRSAATDALEESLVEICGEAGDLPVHLEVFDREVDKKCLIGPTSAAAELAARVRSRAANFGLMIDLSHLPLQGESIRDALAAAKPFLTHVHVGNCVVRDRAHPQYGDLHPRFGIPGGENGVPELAEFFRGLVETGYLARGARRVVSAEVKPVKGETSADLVAQTKRTWEEAWELAKIGS